MAGQVLALFADNLTQPLFDFRIVDVVVINPALVASVVGRIDVDALDAPLVPGQQGFQGFKAPPGGGLPLYLFRSIQVLAWLISSIIVLSSFQMRVFLP